MREPPRPLGHGVVLALVRRDGDAAANLAGNEAELLRVKFLAAMDDDFNTAVGIATLFDFVRLVNKYIDQHGLEKKSSADVLSQLSEMMLVLRELTDTLGLFLTEPIATRSGADEKTVSKLMELVIEIRSRSRAAKDFATADLVRTKLAEAGIVVEDRADGTLWSRKKEAT